MILCALDFETTGLDKDADRVIESGLSLYSTGHHRFLDSVGQLVKGSVKVTPKIHSITGIQQSAVDHFGYEENDALSTLFEFVNQADAVVGHNIRSFDWPMAEKWASRLGRVLPSVHLVDTFEDIPNAEPEALITMLAKAGMLLADAHSALADAQGSVKLMVYHGADQTYERSKVPTVAVRSHAPRTQDNRENKEAKFRWNPGYKIWWKAVKETDVEALAQRVPFPISVVDKSIPIEYLRNG